jgi:hypothetical protein
MRLRHGKVTKVKRQYVETDRFLTKKQLSIWGKKHLQNTAKMPSKRAIFLGEKEGKTVRI